jgi:hypothetical protein
MLFVQGADTVLIQQLATGLGRQVSLKMIAEADHSFHVPMRTGQVGAEVRTEFLDALAAWMNRVVAAQVADHRIIELDSENREP